MQTSRRLDDREILLKRQKKIFFQISGAGHEAIQVAAGMVAPGHDWFFPYYRDRALCLTLGRDAEDMLLQAVGAAADPSSGGRQMPSHWSRSGDSTSCAVRRPRHAVTAGGRMRGSAAASLSRTPDAARAHQLRRRRHQRRRVLGIDQSGLPRPLPVLFLIQDNGYAISVPVEQQTPGGIISKLVARLSRPVPTIEVRRHRFLCVLPRHERGGRVLPRRARAGAGPRHCTRPYSHSLSDDERLYKTKPSAPTKRSAIRWRRSRSCWSTKA